MENWIEITMNDSDLMEEFMRMVQEEDEDAVAVEYKPVVNTFSKRRVNSWVKKDKYRRDIKRRFFNLSPGMSKDKLYPIDTFMVILILDESIKHGSYCINHVNHIYYTPRGHFEQFRGVLEYSRGGRVLGTGNKDHDKARITNRRIRHMGVEEDDCLRYSYYQKMLAPKDYGVL